MLTEWQGFHDLGKRTKTLATWRRGFWGQGGQFLESSSHRPVTFRKNNKNKMKYFSPKDLMKAGHSSDIPVTQKDWVSRL